MEKALEAMEWSLIRGALASRTRSPLGQAIAEVHAPFATRQESERLRKRVVEAKILSTQSPVHGYLADTSDPHEMFERAGRDAVLAAAEVYICGHFMQTVGEVGVELRARQASTPNWASDFAQAPAPPVTCERIVRSVSPDGFILDTASPELARLRRERVEKRAAFESSLTTKIKEWHGQGLLQDNFYDVQDGRYVVPVKVEHQGKLDGAIHSRSNTGQSVFIEPSELLTSNNALKQIDLAIRSEEYRILRALSGEIGGHAHAFMPWVPVIAELDLTLAAAILAIDWELHEPKVPEDATQAELRLVELFHPMLKSQNIAIVKNSVRIPAGGFGLLISGPNTGGKTVLLKAAALAATMSSSGLFIPADGNSQVPHYSDVLAFIGDEQNLSEGLSSFSGQILDMSSVLSEKRSPLLIVIDEMLSSTDPEEASALAQTLIEEFVARGHHVFVTSHFSDLSLRCRQLPQMAVAAMEFEGGRPTYRMRADEMGSSHALEIAERLGFPEKLLTRAKSLLSSAKRDYEKAQAQLKEKERLLEIDYDRRRQELLLEVGREREGFKQEIRAQVEAFMALTRSTLDDSVKALSQRVATYTRQGINARVESAAKEARERLEEGAADIEAAIAGKVRPVRTSVAPIEKGSVVKVRSMSGARGQVLELTEDGIATVQVGNFRLQRPLEDLERLNDGAKASVSGRVKNSYVGADYSTESPTSSRLDLRGKRYDEALGEAERFIDQAFRSGYPSVTVITGHGTGALKKGLKELLGGLPYVREFKAERANDDGATLIEFDR